nr:hypothetical protein [Tanacetum cinerariifolium]
MSGLVTHDLEGHEFEGLYDGGEGDCKKTLGESGGESFWEEGDDFRVDVLHFHTCLTDILGFLEKLRWWFEQYIDGEEGWMKMIVRIGQSMIWIEGDAKDGLARKGSASLRLKVGGSKV